MPVVRIKPILYRPRDLAGRMRREIEAAFGRIDRGFSSDFARTCQTWQHQVAWQKSFVQARDWTFTYGTDDEIYTIVTLGARAHVIRARNAKRLAFQVGYTPKTTPHSLDSVTGGKFGDMAYPAQVLHPGHVARKFEDQVADKYRSVWLEWLQGGIRNAVA